MADYIHQLSDWPVLSWDDGRIVDALAAVRYRQGRLVGRMEALGAGLRAEACLASLTEEVVASSEIEGETLDREQVRSSLARRLGMDVAGAGPVDRDVDGAAGMTLDATQNPVAPLTPGRLFEWHASLFPSGRSGMSRITVGAWRTDDSGPMQVVSGPIGRATVHFEAPAADGLAQEMQFFLEWFNDETDTIDPVVKAGVAHLWFVTVHPFDDGNGRVARAIAEMAMARSDNSSQRFYSMSAQIRAERDAYYAILEATQKGGLDITAWLLWFLACLNRSFSRAEGVVATVLTKARFWNGLAGEVVNVRQRKVLSRLLDGIEGKLTSSKWAAIAKTSQDTAGRDIADLVRRGILVRDAAGGRSTSYSLARLDEGDA